MDLGLAGKRAVIVGAGADVGRATAQLLAAEGAVVMLVGRNARTLSETAAGLVRGAVHHVVVADLRQAADALQVRDAAHAAMGGADILVNTVGPFPMDVADPLRADDESWQRAFDTIVMTAVRICRAFVPDMMAAGAGAVVNVAANSARYYHPRTAQYGAMKSALTHLTKNWAREGARHGVRVNAVLPGWIRTAALLRRLEAASGGKMLAEIEGEMVGGHDSIFWTPRMGRPEEYARVIAFLVSDAASYMNGALVPVDGGSPVW